MTTLAIQQQHNVIENHARISWKLHSVDITKEFGAVFDRVRTLKSRALLLLPEHDGEFTDRSIIALRAECRKIPAVGLRNVFLRGMTELLKERVDQYYISRDYDYARSLVLDAHNMRKNSIKRLSEVIEFATKLHTAVWTRYALDQQSSLAVSVESMHLSIDDAPSIINCLDDFTIEKLQKHLNFFELLRHHKENTSVQFIESTSDNKYLNPFKKNSRAYLLLKTYALLYKQYLAVQVQLEELEMQIMQGITSTLLPLFTDEHLELSRLFNPIIKRNLTDAEYARLDRKIIEYEYTNENDQAIRGYQDIAKTPYCVDSDEKESVVLDKKYCMKNQVSLIFRICLYDILDIIKNPQ